MEAIRTEDEQYKYLGENVSVRTLNNDFAEGVVSRIDVCGINLYNEQLKREYRFSYEDIKSIDIPEPKVVPLPYKPSPDKKYYETDDKMVSHPPHYQSESGLEVIDVIEAFTDGLNGIEAADTANVIKYICRWKSKNGLQDLKKAMWYLQHLISHVENKETKES